MNIHYDNLKEEYLDKIAALDKMCFTLNWSRELFASELTNPHAHYILAFLGDELVAYGGIISVAGEGSITNIAVHPDYRHRGIASSILQNLISQTADDHLEFITLEVRESNTNAIKLYEKFGFKKVGSRKNYYYDNHETALLMTKFLN